MESFASREILKCSAVKSLLIIFVILAPAVSWGRSFFDSNKEYSVGPEVQKNGTVKVLLRKKGEHAPLITITDEITNLSLKVFWSPDSSKFILDMWNGAKGRQFDLYVRNGKSFRPFAIKDADAVSFSNFNRDIYFLNWSGDLSSFRLAEIIPSQENMVKIIYYNCIIKKDGIESKFASAEKIEEGSLGVKIEEWKKNLN